MSNSIYTRTRSATKRKAESISESPADQPELQESRTTLPKKRRIVRQSEIQGGKIRTHGAKRKARSIAETPADQGHSQDVDTGLRTKRRAVVKTEVKKGNALEDRNALPEDLSDSDKAFFNVLKFCYDNEAVCKGIAAVSTLAACVLRSLSKKTRKFVNEELGPIRVFPFSTITSETGFSTYNQDTQNAASKIEIIVNVSEFNKIENHPKFPQGSGPAQLVITVGVVDQLRKLDYDLLIKFRKSIRKIEVRAYENQLDEYFLALHEIHLRLNRLDSKYINNPIPVKLELTCTSQEAFLGLSLVDDDGDPSWFVNCMQRLQVSGKQNVFEPIDVNAFSEKLNKIPSLKYLVLFNHKVGVGDVFFLPSNVDRLYIGEIAGDIRYLPGHNLKSLQITHLMRANTAFIPSNIRFLKIENCDGKVVFSNVSECVNVTLLGNATRHPNIIPIAIPDSVSVLEVSHLKRAINIGEASCLSKLTVHSVSNEGSVTVPRHPKSVSIYSVYGEVLFEKESRCRELYVGHMALGSVLHVPSFGERLIVNSFNGSLYFPEDTKLKSLKINRYLNDAHFSIPDTLKSLSIRGLHKSLVLPPSSSLVDLSIESVAWTSSITVPVTVRSLSIEQLFGNLIFPEGSECTEIKIGFRSRYAHIENSPVGVQVVGL